jgi:hypothetical protein
VVKETSPGKSIFLHPIPAVSTIKRVFNVLGRYNDVLAYPLSIASYTVSVRQYRIL